MQLYYNRRGVSSEVLKMAAAMLLALAVFSMLASFALGPKQADSTSAEAGSRLLNYTQETALEILTYE